MMRMRGRRRGTSASSRSRSPRRWLWDGLLTIAILGLLILLAARLDGAGTRSLDGRAIVNDGDSITLGTERVRLRGIDAPEFAQTCSLNGADYPCGRKSRQALVALIDGRTVSCYGWERDKYDRLLASCTVAGAELNRSQVAAGWAVAYGEYHAEEETARSRGAGLWAGSFDRPRDWREMHGDMSDVEPDATGLLDWLRRLFRLS
jgi:endonuclease YncB( thermonuclease family)